MKNQQRLTIEEMNFCKVCGTNRHVCNLHRQDIKAYTQRLFNLQKETAQRLAVVAEAAAFKALGGNVLDHDIEDWAHFVDDPNFKDEHADLFKVVEVRRANTEHSNGDRIPIRGKDLRPGVIILQPLVQYKQAQHLGPVQAVRDLVTFLGWAKYEDYYDGVVPHWWDNPEDTRLVPRRPMETLDIDKVLGRTQ